VIRDRRPDAAAGIVVPALSGYTERVQTGARDGQPWDRLVQRVRTGPPFPVSFPAVDGAVNTVEYFVHHEDVRRAGDGLPPRSLDEDLEGMLWQRLRMMGRLIGRRIPVGVQLESPRGSYTLKAGEPSVTVKGPPGELVLWASGRGDAALVEFSGPDDARTKLAGARLGM
jgi:uncharacterized protein (TIGR03085 family)